MYISSLAMTNFHPLCLNHDEIVNGLQFIVFTAHHLCQLLGYITVDDSSVASLSRKFNTSTSNLVYQEVYHNPCHSTQLTASECIDRLTRCYAPAHRIKCSFCYKHIYVDGVRRAPAAANIGAAADVNRVELPPHAGGRGTLGSVGNVQCTWYIHAPQGMVASVFIHELSLPSRHSVCHSNYLQLSSVMSPTPLTTNGNPYANEAGLMEQSERLCGNMINATFLSTTSVLIIKLHTGGICTSNARGPLSAEPCNARFVATAFASQPRAANYHGYNMQEVDEDDSLSGVAITCSILFPLLAVLAICAGAVCYRWNKDVPTAERTWVQNTIKHIRQSVQVKCINGGGVSHNSTARKSNSSNVAEKTYDNIYEEIKEKSMNSEELYIGKINDIKHMESTPNVSAPVAGAVGGMRRGEGGCSERGPSEGTYISFQQVMHSGDSHCHSAASAAAGSGVAGGGNDSVFTPALPTAGTRATAGTTGRWIVASRGR